MFKDRKKFQYHLTCNSQFSLSEGSVNAYVGVIDKFFKHYDEFNQKNIDTYYLELKGLNQPSYINLILNGFKQYAAYVKSEVKIPKEIKKIRNDTKEIVTYEYLTHDIFEAIETGDFNNVYQMKAIVVFMFYSGLRLQDYMNLHRSDFVFKGEYGYTNVYIKKNKFMKKILFPKKVIEHLTHYFDTSEEDENAFNLKKSTIKNLFIRLNDMLSDISLHPHIMRRSSITHLYNECNWRVEEMFIQGYQLE